MSAHEDELECVELNDGRIARVHVAWRQHDYDAFVLRTDDDDEDGRTAEWSLHWTDGVNDWVERYDHPWHALARLAALVAACEQQVFMVHDGQRNPAELRAFVDEAERFVSRTVHASSCRADCDGTDPTNHRA